MTGPADKPYRGTVHGARQSPWWYQQQLSFLLLDGT